MREFRFRVPARDVLRAIPIERDNVDKPDTLNSCLVIRQFDLRNDLR